MAKNKSSVISSTIFSLNKRILPSDAVFYGGTWESRFDDYSRAPLYIAEKTVRGTMSHHIDVAVASDPLKIQKEVEKANIQLIDSCSLSPTQDSLFVDFTVNFLPCNEGLEACNNPEYGQIYQDFLQTYSNQFGYRELANRYAYNIASGKFLWKNKVGADEIEIYVTTKHSSQMVFDAFSVGSLEKPSAKVEALGELIEQAFLGEISHLLLNVSAAVKRGYGQVVYPSQEFIQDKNGNNDKGKVLYQVGGIAAYHDQKIGNALRTIDTWYDGFDDFNRPISIEVYGAVTNLSKAFRSPATKQDYHSLMNKMVNSNSLSPEEQHYLVAMMIRGGVLGTKK